MADKKVNEEEVKASDPIIRELVDRVEALPRTDHMTLPAIMITEIDPETRARMASIQAINAATSPDDVIDEEGKTLAQVRREYEFGVSEEGEEGGKHSFKFEEGENGIQKVTIIPPVNTIINAQGEEEEVTSAEVVIEPTPANIAPIDADAPKNPAEKRALEGEDDSADADLAKAPGLPVKVGSQSTATGGVAPSAPAPGMASPSVPSAPSASPSASPSAPSTGGTGGGNTGGTGGSGSA